MIFLSNIQQLLFPPSPYHRHNLPEHCQNIPERDGIIYIVWMQPDEEGKSNVSSLLTSLKALANDIESTSIKLWLRDDTIVNKMNRSSYRDDGSRIQMVVSLTEPSSSLKALEAFLNEAGMFTGQYYVKNSVPLKRARNHDEATDSPGIVSMSFFQAKVVMSVESFQEYWFLSHTPFALEIHPLCQYERNRVTQIVHNDAPRFAGIVPLSVEHEHDLSIKKFFSANDGFFLRNMFCILSDVRNFLDLKQIQTISMREYVLK